jgi:hypothetical protein
MVLQYKQTSNELDCLYRTKIGVLICSDACLITEKNKVHQTSLFDKPAVKCSLCLFVIPNGLPPLVCIWNDIHSSTCPPTKKSKSVSTTTNVNPPFNPYTQSQSSIRVAVIPNSHGTAVVVSSENKKKKVRKHHQEMKIVSL